MREKNCSPDCRIILESRKGGRKWEIKGGWITDIKI
jgi:hypothetical protein